MKPSQQQHYDEHLAAYYSWSVGGAEAAIARARAELEGFGVALDGALGVIDLGAGFGAHAIALARRGATVTAVDESHDLLEELRSLAQGLAIDVVEQDIVHWIEAANQKVDLVLCMGDTLNHLPSPEHARRLLQAGASRLCPAGTLVVTFRDYTQAAMGSDSHLVVRSEPTRIATCVVEHRESGVFVRDLLHELVDASWRVKTSRYVKLRLDPDQVVGWLETLGFGVTLGSTPSGMAAVVATNAVE